VRRCPNCKAAHSSSIDDRAPQSKRMISLPSEIILRLSLKQKVSNPQFPAQLNLSACARSGIAALSAKRAHSLASTAFVLFSCSCPKPYRIDSVRRRTLQCSHFVTRRTRTQIRFGPHERLRYQMKHTPDGRSASQAFSPRTPIHRSQPGNSASCSETMCRPLEVLRREKGL
jgi:hypothetical protein